MSKNQGMTTMNGTQGKKDQGFKVIEVNVSSPTEGLYAVCTPVRIKEQGKLWEK